MSLALYLIAGLLSVIGAVIVLYYAVKKKPEMKEGNYSFEEIKPKAY